MNTYDYMCVTCNTVREVVKALSEYVPGKVEFCPECGEPMRRVFLRVPNFHVKGGTGAQKRAR